MALLGSVVAAEIKAVIFDCDGTLVDSEHAHFVAGQVCQTQGHQLTWEEYVGYMGKGDLYVAQAFAKRFGCCDQKESMLEEKHRHFERLQHEGLPVISPTVEFLSRLGEKKEKLGLKLAVASAARKADVMCNIRNLGIEHLLDLVLSGADDLQAYSDPTGVNKPKPYIYLHAAKLLGVAPSECVVIEDSPSGVRASVTAGCVTVAVPNLLTQHQDLSLAHVEVISFDSMEIEDFFSMIKELSP